MISDYCLVCVSCLLCFVATVKGVGRLVDGRNVTKDEDHMWSFSKNPRVTWAVKLTISLVTRTDLVGLRLWNYNPSLDDSFVGVKWLKVRPCVGVGVYTTLPPMVRILWVGCLEAYAFI